MIVHTYSQSYVREQILLQRGGGVSMREWICCAYRRQRERVVGTMRKGSSSGKDEKEVSDSKDEEEGLYMTMRESSHIPTEVEERVKEENGGKVKKSKKRTTRASTHAMILGMDADEEEGHRGSFCVESFDKEVEETQIQHGRRRIPLYRSQCHGFSQSFGRRNTVEIY